MCSEQNGRQLMLNQHNQQQERATFLMITNESKHQVIISYADIFSHDFTRYL